MTSSIFLTMAGWTSDKFRLSCLENQGLKRALLKMLILDNGNSKNNVQTSFNPCKPEPMVSADFNLTQTTKTNVPRTADSCDADQNWTNTNSLLIS